MARRPALPLALLLVTALLSPASACYFARQGAVKPSTVDAQDSPSYRRALLQARMLPGAVSTCSNVNINIPTVPKEPTQKSADLKIRDLAWQVIMKGGANSVGLLKPNCTLANVNPTNTATAWNCVDWQTLGQRQVLEPIPPAVVDPLNVTQAFSLGTFVRLAFHDCGAARRTGITTTSTTIGGRIVRTTTHNFIGGCDDSFMWEAQYGVGLNGAMLTTNAGADPATTIVSYPANGIPAPDTRTGVVRDYPGLNLLGNLPICVPDAADPTQCAIDPETGLVAPFILFNPNGDPSMSMAHWRIQQWKLDIDALIAADPKFKSPKPKVSRADLIQLAGAAVISLSGGAVKPDLFDKIPMGRKDATGPAHITALMQLPAASDTITQQMCLFQSNGYTAREMVALIATHTLGNNDVAPMSLNGDRFDSSYLDFVKKGGLSLAAGTGQQVDAGFAPHPLYAAPGVNVFLPAFTSDVEFYTMAKGAGAIAVGIGGANNPLEPPAPRTGLPNPLGRSLTLPSPTRGIIDGWLDGATGWATHLSDVAAAYIKMGKMGATAFASYGDLRV